MPYSFRHKICDASSILSDLLALFYLLICLAEELLSPSDFPPAANLGSSVSPYHEVMRMERRLRSSSEGAGGPRVHGNHRDAVGMEGCGLLKHRNNSSSSKMGSLVGALKKPLLFEMHLLTRISRQVPQVTTLKPKKRKEMWSCLDVQRNASGCHKSPGHVRQERRCRWFVVYLMWEEEKDRILCDLKLGSRKFK